MTNEEINRAIAEHLGWMAHPTCKNVWRTPEQAQRNKALIGTVNGPWSMESSGPPNYSEDLNAICEVIEALPMDQYEAVWETLCDMIPYNVGEFKGGLVYNAKAKLRAESFLRTIGKWEENE